MIPITLCPKAATVLSGSPAQFSDPSTLHKPLYRPEEAANTCFRETVNRRERALVRLVQATEHSIENDPMLHDVEIRPLL
jgi:hypothetical protein